ncbi:23S rRNA (pseudouridine(1915)-N(3))-methyltransferase RlmH [Candidatus Uhrbacteria bacterium]|nr:23S rRNA (pseudouridine(1915)-N(3))-methyltransferase RlmH [Candidatus Uhrbacteria bacterium]
MYRITVLTVGKLTEGYWREAQSEYMKRLKPFSHLDIQEYKEEPFSSVYDKARVTAQEGEKILSHMPKDGYIIALDKDGRKISSEEFAALVQDKGERGGHLAFLIGGPLGFSDEVLNSVDARLSLSSLTFTHQLARIVLLEQIYRAMTILHGKKYHY